MWRSSPSDGPIPCGPLTWHCMDGWRADSSVPGRHGTGRVGEGTGADRHAVGVLVIGAFVYGWLYADRRRCLWYGRGVVCTGHRAGGVYGFLAALISFAGPGRAGARGRGAAGGPPAGDGDRAGRLAAGPADRGGSRGGRRAGARTGCGGRQRRTLRGWPAAGAGRAAAGRGGCQGGRGVLAARVGPVRPAVRWPHERTSGRSGHVLVQRRRGLDAAGQGTARAVPSGAGRAPAPGPRRHRRPRRP